MFVPSLNPFFLQPIALLPTNGAWGKWNAWTECTAACNGGKRQRSRFCDTPFPAHGGLDCTGKRQQEEACNTQACPSKMPFVNFIILKRDCIFSRHGSLLLILTFAKMQQIKYFLQILSSFTHVILISKSLLRD